MARPPRSGEVAAVHRVTVRLTAEEAAAVAAAAGAAGVTQSEWLRRGAGVARPVRRAAPGLDPAVARVLAGLGNNLNQLARRANAAARAGEVGAYASAVEVAAVRAELAALRAAVEGLGGAVSG